MRLLARRAIAATLLCLCAGLALRGQTSGQIRGTVVDDEGKALDGVKVEATTSSATRMATTGKDGQFRFPLLAPGTYKVTFTREAYSQVEKNANVRLDGTATVNAKLFRLGG
jgi:Carboxypeptidase regulatory-like domain